MMKSEKERLERITTTWNDLQKQIVENGITRESVK